MVGEIETFFLKKSVLQEEILIPLFLKGKKINQSDLLMVQVYIEDNIFGLINVNMCKEFFNLMQSEFEMNMMEQLMFFLSLQIKQYFDGIFIC